MYAIIGAMKEEVDALLAICKNVQLVSTLPFTIHKAELSEAGVYICQSGIGKANAAMTTTHLINNFDIEAIINIGSAGGLKKNQEPGDIVIADQTTYYDVLFDPENPSYHMEDYTFTVDQAALRSMEKAVQTLNIPYHIGQITTGDQFVCSQAQVEQVIQRNPEAMAVEMESCAVLQVSNKYKIPAVIMRSLSDIAVKEGNKEAFDKYIIRASRNSARACQIWLEINANK